MTNDHLHTMHVVGKFILNVMCNARGHSERLSNVSGDYPTERNCLLCASVIIFFVFLRNDSGFVVIITVQTHTITKKSVLHVAVIH